VGSHKPLFPPAWNLFKNPFKTKVYLHNPMDCFKAERESRGQHRVLLAKTPTESISGSTPALAFAPSTLSWIFPFSARMSIALLPQECLGSDAGDMEYPEKATEAGRGPYGTSSLPFANLQWLVHRDFKPH
jgi:hypothetical protein